jgi:arylsulfatase B
MDRREFIRKLTAGSIIAGTSPSFLLNGCAKESGNPPNIILIVSDDQGYADMSCTGLNKDARTPNLDRLAANGVRFTQAYATSPICNPSRAGLITGCYQERWGTWWYGGPGIHDPGYKTIPELLKTVGYKTGYVGKVHYGISDSDTANRSFPLNHGFDSFFGFTSARKHYLIHQQEKEDEFQQIKEKYDRMGQSLRQQPLWDNFEKVNVNAFTTEIFSEKACAFIDKNKSKPFFLQVAFNAVHNFTHQLPPEYLHEEGLKGYHDWDPATEEYYEWYKAGRKPNNPEGRAHYLGQLHFLDREIGKILDHLTKTGMDKNTVIFYISDNGGSTPIYADNTPLRGSKYLLYEGGIRVPMIISYPKKYIKGTVINNVVSAMDILPTICGLTGLKSPEYVDGNDLNPLLKGANTGIRHDTLVWDTGHEIAVRSGNWKLHIVLNDDNAKYEMVEVELGEFLCDLEADPGETTNLKDQYPDVFESLKEVHAKWKEEMLEK